MEFIKDFLTFRRMISPVLIQILYWISLLICLGTGIATMAVGQQVGSYGSGGSPISGLLIIIVGPLIIRVLFEYAIIAFSTHREVAGARRILKRIAIEGYSIKIVDDDAGSSSPSNYIDLSQLRRRDESQTPPRP